MQKIPVSVVVMTKNEERNIAKCLKALAEFDEVFVIDSRSTDATCALAPRWARRWWTSSGTASIRRKTMVPGAAAFLAPGRPVRRRRRRDDAGAGREIRASLPRFEAGAGGAFVPFDYVFCGRKLRHGHRV